ncbi:MAG: hypothetical protein KGJ57_21850, partial [Sphingomonadales bacterium]|nr:hypothetical protein [Sphingomonadales bacterium]
TTCCHSTSKDTPDPPTSLWWPVSFSVNYDGRIAPGTSVLRNARLHLNRKAHQQGIFWAIIGHTPKDAAKKVEDAAIERLRGSAMWSTTPRSVVEVRLATSSDDLSPVRADHPGLTDRDVVIVQVAKANSENADLRPRALLRRRDGAYDDITAAYPELFASTAEAGSGRADKTEIRKALLAILATFSDGKPGTKISREELRAAVSNAKSSDPTLGGISDVIDGNAAKKRGTLAAEIAQLAKDKVIDTSRGGHIKIIDLGLPVAGREPEPVE